MRLTKAMVMTMATTGGVAVVTVVIHRRKVPETFSEEKRGSK